MSARPLRIVGLDLSLTSTGMSDGLDHRAVQTDASLCMEERLSNISGEVGAFTRDADLAVIEGPAFSRVGPGHEELAALRYMVRVGLWRRRVPFALVSPTSLKKFTTGNGKATKQQMQAAVQAAHGVDFSNVLVKDGRYDRVDAFALRAMGAARVAGCGDGCIRHPAAHRASLDGVAWPDLWSDN